MHSGLVPHGGCVSGSTALASEGRRGLAEGRLEVVVVTGSVPWTDPHQALQNYWNSKVEQLTKIRKVKTDQLEAPQHWYGLGEWLH